MVPLFSFKLLILLSKIALVLTAVFRLSMISCLLKLRRILLLEVLWLWVFLYILLGTDVFLSYWQLLKIFILIQYFVVALALEWHLIHFIACWSQFLSKVWMWIRVCGRDSLIFLAFSNFVRDYSWVPREFLSFFILKLIEHLILVTLEHWLWVVLLFIVWVLILVIALRKRYRL